MTGRQDRRIEFHARSAEHKKEFEAKLKETGQTKSEFLRAFMDDVISGRDDGEHAAIATRDAQIARLERENEDLSAALFTKGKALSMTRDELTGIRAEKFGGLTDIVHIAMEVEMALKSSGSLTRPELLSLFEDSMHIENLVPMIQQVMHNLERRGKVFESDGGVIHWIP